ncbi:nicotinate phosphoribosyltransferase [Pisciglobus halotolerans]|uniref:Nicotinate phosphoribosyltransferase n=1 Tax=Pisciglobus halotolerans TaxID=745365 RepID=A0A1I3BKZ9_9LACT|nr:nicotinate phosphoribosyltransferase [Pisciglobus halotolerans]SFH62942.1 nicotinate phosphoribosyltransferase [Pisciglobus halotolerans]
MTKVYRDDSQTLHTDMYQINMMKTYWEMGKADKKAVFEAYYRENPFGIGYGIFAGLERVVNYIKNLRFTDADIAFLRETQDYPEDFLTYLKEFTFAGTIRSAVEGELVFANEPFIQVEGPLAHCQLVETAILNIVNFQTLIATKTSEFRTVVDGDPLLEFGTRRAQEMDAALWGTRAAYIGGADGTSNVRAGKIFGIPVSGTHAHALVQAYRDDYQAFKAYAQSHKDCVFLVDTYDTLRSGVPNAIRVADEMGDKINFLGVRIDSGDMAYISKQVRKKLDEAGYPNAKIYASNNLDVKTILNLKMQGAKVDVWGVGTKLITAYEQPALGGVYKLVSIEDDDGQMHDTIKLTNNAEKVSTPGKKQVWRITSNEQGKSEGDYITFWDERPDQQEELFMFHPVHTYVNKTVKNFTARPVLREIFVEGKLVYELPTLEEIKHYAQDSLSSLWEEYKRGLNPEPYPVDLSQKLYDNKIRIIHETRQKVKDETK